ncbi:glycosyltransferase [Azonexus sp.]|uniref:glycosyltransferase n=1 Tax=Azonexus sp. TaxID=1872668 RepID=UPI0035AF734F
MRYLAAANKAFLDANYSEALVLYNKAKDFVGEKVVDANIKICQKKLKAESFSESSPLAKYFDKIYVVNLRHHTEKKFKITKQLREFGIGFELVQAVNGYVGAPKLQFDDYVNKPLGSMTRFAEWNSREVRRGGHFIESPGAIGYIHTYLNILRDAKNRGYKKFLILEDDVILCRDFLSAFDGFLAGLPLDWKVLQLGASQYGWESVDLVESQKCGYYYPRRLDTCGSFAIAFDHSIVDELIELESYFEAPFDHLPLGEIYEKYIGKCFVSYPNIVMPDVGSSSIRGGRCQYAHGLKMKWNVGEYNYPYPRVSLALIISSKTNLKYFESFDRGSRLPVELRLYYASSDGFRPLHNPQILPADYDIDEFDYSKNIVPSADFAGIIDESITLTESDIDSYMCYVLGLANKNSTKISPISLPSREIVSGRVSVIVPTYKRPSNLELALRSVFEQNYSDFEVVVVNDNGAGSEYNEETKAVFERVASDFPNVDSQYIEHSKNRNGSAARNTGIIHSTGEYVCFLDDDDVYLPGRLEKSVEVLKSSNGKEGGVYCGFIGWNSPSNDLNRYKSGDLTAEILLLDYKKHYLHTDTATYKRKAVLAINGFDESYRRHQDLEFNLRFFELFDIGITTESGVRLNPQPSSVSNKVFGFEMFDLKVRFLKQFKQLIDQLDNSVVDAIYEKHWLEVAKYIKNKNEFLKMANARLEDGLFQVMSKLEVGGD